MGKEQRNYRVIPEEKRQVDLQRIQDMQKARNRHKRGPNDHGAKGGLPHKRQHR